MTAPLLFSRWAKAGTDGAFHLLPFHGLDVAAVLAAGFERNPALLSRVAAGLGMPDDAARAMLLTLAALHDVGK